jgi:hypothetical protein
MKLKFALKQINRSIHEYFSLYGFENMKEHQFKTLYYKSHWIKNWKSKNLQLFLILSHYSLQNKQN